MKLTKEGVEVLQDGVVNDERLLDGETPRVDVGEVITNGSLDDWWLESVGKDDCCLPSLKRSTWCHVAKENSDLDSKSCSHDMASKEVMLIDSLKLCYDS